VLSPEEIHRLASKTRHGVGADAGKAACHSDIASPGEAQEFQVEKLDPSTLEPIDRAAPRA
jgi:phosphomethylpyrimidine synthase